ncbi:MAG TPA: hypothetical protein DCM67_02840 [Propionibacteriaceae bacterium]|nr:hypothetical protein [Propionibacteriaceae bacterium]
MGISLATPTSRIQRRWWATGLVAALFAGVAATTPATAAAPDPTTLVTTAGTTWKYLDNGTEPCSTDDLNAWTSGGFDDSTWKSAAGGFGSKNGTTSINGGTIKTLLNQYIDPTASQKVDIPTFFFRSTFDLTDAQVAELDSLAASVTYDDAVRIYVNGTKVAHYYDDRATSTTTNLQYAGASNGDPETSVFTVPAAEVHAGTNTIAVALYQDRETSSDIYLDFSSLIANYTDPDSVPQLSDVSFDIGADASQRNLAWYSSMDVSQSVEVAPASAMTGDTFPAAQATSFASDAAGSATESGSFYRHATVTGLTPATAYVYRIGNDAAWSPTYSFQTQADDHETKFVAVGDVQEGASSSLTNDRTGWQNTLDSALTAAPDTDFILSLGDQVNSAANEDQYTAFLAPDQLKSVPLAATIGNHDVGSLAYSQHFNMPNVDASHGAGSSTSSGGDYWFSYGDALFLDLNSNNTDNASHAEFVSQTIAAHPNFRWQIVVFHHSIYSTASHANDSDIVARRAALSQIMSNADIDLVLMGHDHVYARTWLMKDGAVSEDTSKGAQSTLAAKPGEVLYVTGNSASGSKYYAISGNYDWTAVTTQDQLPSYTEVTVTDSAITLNTVHTSDRSVIDSVKLTQADVTDPVITLPSNNQLSVDDSFDPMTGVSATDDTDGDLTSAVMVSGQVNTSVPGSYELTYSVSDAAGNSTTIKRTVTVVSGTLTGTGVPAIGGMVKVGSVVSAVTPAWQPTPTFSFQWLLNGKPLAGKTSARLMVEPSYALGRLSVQVTGTRTGYETMTQISAAVTVAKADFSAVSKPKIKGKARVGARLSVNTGKWSPAPAFTFRWYANGKAIKGATGTRLKLTGKLKGKRISVKVVATKTGYTTRTVTSARTSKVKR